MSDLASLGFRVDSSGLRRATTDLDRLDGQGRTTTSTVQSLGKAFVALGAAAGVSAAIRGSINSFADFERGLIGVGKTTNISGAELDGLGKSIRELSRDLPVASDELLAIAQSAGQLGVNGTANILRFTDTVGKLGMASDLSGEQAATSLARILTVTGTAISEVDRLGSTIVQLGNSFAATESEITGVATRVAQSTAQFDVSAAQVLGISAALKAVGVEAEAGGTQIGLSFQVINDALRSGGSEMELLQQITGRTGEALREAFFNGNSARVFQDFVNGLGKIQSSGGDVASALDAMGLKGVRATQVFGTLATRTDVLADALSQANTEWDSNIALNKEAAVASESFSAQLQLVKNAADEAASAVGAIIAPAALDGLGAFRDASISVADNIDILKATLAGLAGAAAPIVAITVATRAATVAQIAFNIAARANPYLLLATVLGAAAAAVWSLNDSFDPAIDRAEKLKKAIGGLTDNLDLLTRAELENRKISLAQDMIESRAEAEKLAAQLGTVQDIIKNSGQLTPQGGAMQIATTEDINRARALKAEIEELTIAGDASAGAIEKVNALIASLGQKSKDASSGQDDLSGSTGAAAEAVQKIISGLQDEYLQLTLTEEQLLRHKLAAQGASESQIALAQSILKASRAIEEQRKQEDALSEMRRELDPAFAEFDRYADQIDQIEAFNITMQEKEKLREDAFWAHQDNMAQIAEDGSDKITDSSDNWAEKIAQNQQQIDTQMAQTLGNTIGVMRNFAEEGSAIWIAMTMAQKGVMAAQAIMAANLAASLALTAQVPGDPSAPAKAIAQAEMIRALGYANAGLILAQGVGEVAGARVSGGSVSSGSSYLVGEKGPEIVTMGGSGHVTPNNKIGGGGISVTINDQTTTSTGHDVQTQETTGPEGQRQMQITIRDTVRRQVMQGEFDRQLGSKFDLKSKGRRV